LLAAYPDLHVIGLDRDPIALDAARERLAPFGERVTLIHAPFSSLGDVTSGPLSGVLFDLGVSSPQLDQPDRGFSYRAEGAIDMRMDQSTGRTAGQLVNELPESALASLFRENGEGRLSGRIAHAVVAARPLTSTVQLAEVVASAVPAAVRRRGNPATRVFQALRIAVNDELAELQAALPVALERLAVGGRCAVISYHSGEDRLAKQVFAKAVTGGCTCPPGLPCVCGAVARHELVFRGARRPSESEMVANRRAQSARLRAIVRTEAD
jgi:16S rRNA (cytosine1402-N4)-methyltransferase